MNTVIKIYKIYVQFKFVKFLIYTVMDFFMLDVIRYSINFNLYVIYKKYTMIYMINIYVLFYCTHSAMNG